MSFPTKPWLQRLAFTALLVLACLVTLPILRQVLSAGTGLVLSALLLAAYVFTLIIVPFTVIWLVRFAYSIFGKPYFRAWHINRIRNARLLREAIARTRADE